MDSTTSTAALRIFVVEDSTPVRERLMTLLGSVEGARVIGHADRADDAIRSILAERPEAVVLDLNLAQGTGIDVLKAVHDEAPEIDIFVLTTFAIPPYERLCMRLGARGFFDKSTEFEQVRDAIASRAHHQVQ